MVTISELCKLIERSDERFLKHNFSEMKLMNQKERLTVLAIYREGLQ